MTDELLARAQREVDALSDDEARAALRDLLAAFDERRLTEAERYQIGPLTARVDRLDGQQNMFGDHE